MSKNIDSYTAGFLDADGSVTMYRSHATAFRIPRVEFYNCDLAILEFLQEHWSGRIIIRRPKNVKHNDSYTLQLNSSASLQLLFQCLPFMLHQKKSKRASLIVSYYRSCTPRNGKYTTDQLETKRWLEEAVMSIKMRGK